MFVTGDIHELLIFSWRYVRILMRRAVFIFPIADE